MANDIKFGVDYTQVKAANAELQKIGSTAQRSASTFEKAFLKAERAQKASLASVKSQIVASQRLEAQRAKEVKSNVTALNQQRVAYQANTKELYRIRMATDSVFAAEQKLLGLKKLLRTEIANGNMTMREAARVQMDYKQSLASMGNGLNQTARRTNQLGVMMQQTGYQVGDFAVQVGSGQNAMVAFGQQATQLVGTMAMFAKTTKMIALFSGLGIAIPVISGIAAAYMRMGDASDDAADGAKEFGDKLKSAREEVQGMKDDLNLLKSGLKDVFVLTLTDSVKLAEKKLKEARENFMNTIAAGTGMAAGAGIDVGAFFRDSPEEAEARVKAAEQELRSAKLLLEQKIERNRNESITNQLHEVRQQKIEDAFELEKQLSAEMKSGNQALQEAITLRGIEAAYGNDSVQYLAQTQEYERQALETRIQSEGITGELANRLRDALAYAQGIAQLEMASGIDAAAASAMNLAKNFGIAYNAAYRLSLLQNASAKTAGIAGGFSGFGSTQGGMVGNNTLGFGNTTDPNRPTPITDISGFGSGTKGKGGGGGGSKESPQEKFAEYLADKQKELELETKLVGIFDTEREIQSELFKARDEYSGVITPAQEKELENTLRQTEAIKEQQTVLEEAKAQQEALADTISGAMGDAFMSIIDGTKSAGDAFKDMARLIISELFKILVIEKMVKSISGAISGAFGGGTPLASADGNVFSGGSHVQAYADGGVVGSPTYFPMSGGKTGLMGEDGLEAIMPLKRGSNGKLGVQMEGGGATTVVQNFNFQANGDESVKKLIAQAAPKIAQMTKSSMLDDRRRGGSTKAAFG